MSPDKTLDEAVTKLARKYAKLEETQTSEKQAILSEVDNMGKQARQAFNLWVRTFFVLGV